MTINAEAEREMNDNEKDAAFQEMIARHRKANGKGADWYAIRTAPGTQRMAKAVEMPETLEGEYKLSNEHRNGESIIERSLRNEGIDVYMPSYWHEIVHHRTNRIIEKRLPLMVGYAFVHLPDLAFERVRGVDGVVCFLQSSRERGPARFRADDLAVIAAEELSRRQQFRLDRFARLEQEKSGKIMSLRTSIRKHLKKGRSTRINLKEQAMLAIRSMDELAREKVLGMLHQLETLEGDDTLALIDCVA